MRCRRAAEGRGRGQMKGGGWQLTTDARERGRGSTCKESGGESARGKKSVQGMLVCRMRVQMQAGLVCGWVKQVDVGS